MRMGKKDIVAETIQLLRAAKEEIPASQIAKECDVKESWLRMFIRGEIPNPGVRQFTQVREYLERRDQ